MAFGQKVEAFVQEGIGALLAYLPPATAIQTLTDFLSILGKPKTQVMSPFEEVKVQRVVPPKPIKPAEAPLIEYTGHIELPEMRGQVDYLASIDNDTFIVGSTIG